MSGRATDAPHPSITACVIARNEAKNLREGLPGLRWADEVLVLVDAATTDESMAVATPLADRVEQAPFRSFSDFRNRALALASGTWVFFVDADERVSSALAAEIREATSGRGLSTNEPQPTGYWIPRHNVILGRLVRGGGWWPDYQLRLLRRGAATYDPARAVHETVLLNGPSDYLDEPLLHLNYTSIGQIIHKQRRYAELEAESLRTAGARPRVRALVAAPIREFWRRYVVLAGWTDGPIGLLLSVVLAYYAFKTVLIARR
ncbi:MAG TPA: glycosyltransferase family 2 protein [Chloroflexota bacterium]|nr:glycosyltransferase family 2 protein [Chloroflexota bacterium]